MERGVTGGGVSGFAGDASGFAGGSGNVRFGVVGTNFITDRIIAAGGADPRFEITAVYSRTAERAAEYAARHHIPYTFTSLEDMAASPVVDAVYIASPNALHARQAVMCLEHGKHVLCEKPFASNAREAREMIAAARKSGRLLVEAMRPTPTPNFRMLREYLPQLGEVRRYFAAFGKYSSRYDALKAYYASGRGAADAGAVGSGADSGSSLCLGTGSGLDASAGSGSGELPNAFNPWLSNGAVMDMGVYAVYPMVALWGRPESVQAVAVKLPSGVDAHGAVNFSYGGGSMVATALYSKMVDMFLPWEIEGENGTVRGDGIDAIRKIEFCERGGEWVDISSPEQMDDDYRHEVSHFIDLVAAGKTESEINTHECSLATMEIIDEVRRQIEVIYPADK